MGQTLLSSLPRSFRQVSQAYISPFSSLNLATLVEMSKSLESGTASSSEPSFIRNILTLCPASNEMPARRKVFHTCSGLLDCRTIPSFIRLILSKLKRRRAPSKGEQAIPFFYPALTPEATRGRISLFGESRH